MFVQSHCTWAQIYTSSSTRCKRWLILGKAQLEPALRVTSGINWPNFTKRYALPEPALNCVWYCSCVFAHYCKVQLLSHSRCKQRMQQQCTYKHHRDVYIWLSGREYPVCRTGLASGGQVSCGRVAAHPSSLLHRLIKAKGHATPPLTLCKWGRGLSVWGSATGC